MSIIIKNVCFKRVFIIDNIYNLITSIAIAIFLQHSFIVHLSFPRKGQ